jgi:O-antigen/teichoic acid export membrane protein
VNATPDTITHRVSRGAFYIAVEKLSGLVSGIVYFALLLRWLGPTNYGIMTLALSFAGFATVVTGNFEMFLERFAAEYEAHGLLRTLRRAHWVALSVKLALGTVAALGLIAAAPVLARKYGIPELAVLLPLLASFVAFDGLSTTGRATLFGIQRFRIMALTMMGFHVSKVVLVAVLWEARQGIVPLAIGLSALAIAQGLVASAVPLWMLRHAEDHATPDAPVPADRGTRALLRQMRRYCLPLLGGRITFLSGQNLSMIVLGKLFAPDLLGLYAYAFRTLERFSEVVNTVSTALLPSLTQLETRGQRDRLRAVFDQAHRFGQLAACALSFLLFAFAREITLVAAGHQFLPAVPMLRLLALVPIARTAQQPLTMLFQAMQRPRTVMWLALTKVATEFTCYFVLVFTLGMIGAAWANLAGAAVSYAAALLVVRRLLPGGAGGRLRVLGRAVLLTAPLMALALLLDRLVPGPRGHSIPAFLAPRGLLGLAARLLLVPVGLLGAFALGLVTGEDVRKFAALPLRGGWMPRVRDALVSVAAWFARATPGRRAALPVVLAVAALAGVRIGGAA